MYRDCKDYENVAKMVISIYEDYGIKTLPISAKELCTKMGIKLIAYADFSIDMTKISDDAYYIPSFKDNKGHIMPPCIFYNSEISSKARIRFSVFHEIKHFIYGEIEESDFNEDMANYFAKYIMCPIPILIYRGVNDIYTIIDEYIVSGEVAKNVLKHLRNRRKIHGNKIFDYEKSLIELIEGGG